MRITGLKKYKYKYDLHVHTSPISVCADFSPEETVRKYKDAGFNGFVLTNHFTPFGLSNQPSKEAFASYYIDGYRETKKVGEKLGLDILLGIEIRFQGSNNDYLVYGISEDDVYRMADYLEGDYKTFYREFKSDKNVIIQAHPFRDHITLCDLDYVDGIEVFNMHPGHNSRIPLATKLLRDNPGILFTGGTDFHHEGHEGLCAFRSSEKVRDSYRVAELIKSRDFILDSCGSVIIPDFFN